MKTSVDNRNQAVPVTTATVRRSASARGGARDLTDPVIIPASVLARVPQGMAPDGLLKESVKDQDLTVTIPFPGDQIDDPDAGDAIVLLFDGSPVGNPVVIDSSNIGEDVPWVLEAALRSEGPHRISYEVVSGFTGDHIAYGPESSLIVDTIEPGRPSLGQLIFDRTIVDGGLTSEKLTELGDVLPGEVPSYEGMAEGDWIFVMVEGWVGEGQIFEVGPGQVGQDMPVEYGRLVLEEAGDGRAEFRYVIEDRAGNRSALSESVFIDLFLTGGIDDFEPPTVALFDDDGLINDADARVPVGVTIPGHDGILEDDTVVVIWGTRRLPPAPVESGHVGQDPLFDVEVPYATIALEWPGSGTAPVDVTYEVFRGPQLLGRATAPATVQVNLTLPGGGDINPITPEHEDLGLPVVTSLSGETNLIPPDDSDKDATATIPFFSTATTPVPVFVIGDELEVTWNTTVVTTPPWRPVTTQEVNAEDDIPITVPGATVATTSGFIPVFYRVRRQVGTAVPGGDAIYNIALSNSQQVEVKSKADLPGGGLPLPVAVFTRANANNAIGYQDVIANNGTPLRIEHYTNKAIGDEISISVQLYWGAGGTGGAVGAPYEPTPPHIVGTDDVFTFFDFPIPVAFLLTLTGDPDKIAVGRAIATYKVVNDKTGPGGIDAAGVPVILDMRFQSPP